MNYSGLHSEIAALRAELDDVKAENATLKAKANSAIFALMTHFQMSRSRAAMLVCLARGGIQSRDDIAEMSCPTITNPKTIDVKLCHLRRLIAPIQITTHWGAGYSLEGEHLAAIRAIIRGTHD